MKKLFLIILIAATYTTAQAQQGLHIAFKAGPQSTWLFNSEDSDNANYRLKSTWGYMMGPSFAYNFNGSLGVGVDFLFSKQGQKYYGDQAETIELQKKYNYFKLPILLHFNSDPDAVAMAQGYIGPQFAFLTSATLESDDLGLEETDIDKIIGIDAVNTVNIGVVFGFGIGFNATDFLQFGMGLRFDAGFTTEDSDALANGAAYAPLGQQIAVPVYSADNGSRSGTFAVTGAIEFSVKYVLRTD